MPKKVIYIIATAIATLSLGCVFFVPAITKNIDNLILLEDSNPGYIHILLKAKAQNGEIILSEIEESEGLTEAESMYIKKHRFLYVDKDGFAEVEPSDIAFFLTTVGNDFPGIEYLTFIFLDGTAIEIPVNDVSESYYGVINEYGIIKEKIYKVDVSIPLISQIDDITNLNHIYDNNNKIIYEFRTDKDGNGIADSNGIAGYEWKYDSLGNLIMQKSLGLDRMPVLNQFGYSELRLEYDEKNSLIIQKYIDLSGQLASTTYGYSEIHKKCDENNKVIYEAYFGKDGMPYENHGGYYAIAQEWDGNNLVGRKYLDENDNPTVRTDGVSEAQWVLDEKKDTWNLELKNIEGKPISLEGINLVRDIKMDEDGWSEWMTPNSRTINCCFSIGTTNLGEKKEGDLYTSSIEIEFRGVRSSDDHMFAFLTQGSQDGEWNVGSVWNSDLVRLVSAPEDGVYKFTTTAEIKGEMDRISTFEIGFRCDCWAEGAFRVRNVIIEKGEQSSEWKPGI